MSAAKGYNAAAGFKKAATWGVPVLLGAGDGIEFVSEGLTPDAQFIEDESLTGKATRLEGDKGNEFHSGDVPMDMKYEGCENLLAHAMGIAGVPAQQGAELAYKHIFKIADNNEGIFGTLAIAKTFRVWEYTTAKVGGFTLACSNGARARLTVPFIPQGLNINAGSGTNNTGTVGSITLPANRDFLLFSQMKVLINNHDGAALAAGTDDVYISEMEVQLTRNYETDDVTTKYGYLIDEPVGDGYTDVMGMLGFSKYNNNPGGNDQLILDLLSKQRKKMQITWIGRLIGGAFTFRMDMYFPNVQFDSGDANVGGPGRVPANLNFRASRRLTTPTGFPANYNDAVVIELVNQRSSNPLA